MKRVLTIPHWKVWKVVVQAGDHSFHDWTSFWIAMERRVFGFELAPPRRCE